MFNADLALSVTMTAISTVLSVFMLPANLLLYANLAYEEDVSEKLDWASVFIALVVVTSAIGLGLYCSYRSTSPRYNIIANRVRSILSNTTQLLVPPLISTIFFICIRLDWKHRRIMLDCLFCHRDKCGRRGFQNLVPRLDVLRRLCRSLLSRSSSRVSHGHVSQLETTRKNVSENL